MYFYDIATKYNEPLEAAHKHIDDDRHDVLLECGTGALLPGPNWTSRKSYESVW